MIASGWARSTATGRGVWATPAFLLDRHEERHARPGLLELLLPGAAVAGVPNFHRADARRSGSPNLVFQPDELAVDPQNGRGGDGFRIPSYRGPGARLPMRGIGVERFGRLG